MSEKSISSQRHVAVLAFPFASHPSTLLGIVHGLAKCAPNVTFSFFSTAKSNASLFSSSFSSSKCEDHIYNIKFYDVSDGVHDGYIFEGRPTEHIDLFLKEAHENFKNGVEVAEKDIGMRVSCIVSDAFLWFADEIAEDYGVSWVPTSTSAAGSLSVHFYTDLIRKTVGKAGFGAELGKFIPGFSEVNPGDFPVGVLPENSESPFSLMLYKMGKYLPRANALLINSFQELEPSIIEDFKHSKLKNVLNVGPYHLISPTPNNSDVHGCIPWLDRQKPGSVAYIAFGNVATPPPPELNALAEALEASNTRFLWSINNKFISNLTQGFLERTNNGIGKIVPWAPQVQVLAHASVGVFINHSGWNSVMESIVAGVPIICRPFLGDHHLNAWMVDKVWKIGVRSEGDSFTKDSTMRALELVLSSEKGKKLKQQIMTYKEHAFKAVGPNGSSTKNFKTLVELITK